MLYKSKFQEDDCPEFSVHDYAFKMLIADIHEDLTVRKQAFLMTQLLQKYLDYRMAACNIWSSLQESATVDISCLISDVFSFDFKLPAVATTCPIDTSLLTTRLNFPCPLCLWIECLCLLQNLSGGCLIINPLKMHQNLTIF
jgi:hypothetical protein